MNGRRSPSRHRRVPFAAVLIMGAALVLPGATPAVAASPADGSNVPCAPVMPLANVEAGQIGTGWTVVKGTVPRSFKVEILGVYPDGIAPGKDMIMVEVSDLPGQSVIAAGDGIWAGMSGSPVYIGSRLVGAVAYGFATGPSVIGGLSPAEDMTKLLNLPHPSAATVAGATGRGPRTRLSAQVRRALSRLTGRSVARAGDFDRLALPIAVSGVGAKGRRLLGERLAAAGIDARVTRGASVLRPAGLYATPQPGGNFSASISYGDVTVGGVGTTTWVCDDRALAFGHPLALNGPSSFGADDATSLTIVKDPTTGPFKLATITDRFGTVDQDRLSGLRAVLGDAPPAFPVIAAIKDLDLDSSRTGRTQVTAADWVPFVAPQHLYADMIAATDREGPGTAWVRVAIEGTRANGDPWSLVVHDRIASSDIQFDAAIELDDLLYRIATNEAEDVRITRVHVRANVQQAVRTATLVRLRVSRNGGPFRTPETLRLRGGDQLVARVVLRDRTGAVRSVDLPLAVPQGASGFGSLIVAGGSSMGSSCDLNPSQCAAIPFPRLLDQIRSEPRSDDLIVELDLEGENGSVRTTRASVRQSVVVSGFLLVNALVE